MNSTAGLPGSGPKPKAFEVPDDRQRLQRVVKKNAIETPSKADGRLRSGNVTVATEV